MTPNAKKLLLNIGTFAILLSSWWTIGQFVAQKAEFHVEQQFESTYLRGSYYNDWLPVISAIACGVGWGIALLVMKENKSERLLSFRWLFLIIVLLFICSLIFLVVGNVNRALRNDLIDPSLMPFLGGVIYGSLFAYVQNVTRDSNG